MNLLTQFVKEKKISARVTVNSVIYKDMESRCYF